MLALLLDGGNAWVGSAVVIACEEVPVLCAETAVVGGEAGIYLALDCGEAYVEDARKLGLGFDERVVMDELTSEQHSLNWWSKIRLRM